MRKNDILLYYAYNRWGNQKILAACAQIPAVQMTAKAPVSFGSLMGTLTHILGAEIVWRMRLQEGISPPRLPGPEDFPSMDSLVEHWQNEETAMRAYLEGVDEDALERWVEYQTTSGKLQGSTLWKALMQVIFHGTQFRAEAGTVLTTLGHSPGDLDFILYLRETGQR